MVTHKTDELWMDSSAFFMLLYKQNEMYLIRMSVS